MLNALCVILRSLSLLFVLLRVFVSSFETVKRVPVCIPTCRSGLNHRKLELYFSLYL